MKRMAKWGYILIVWSLSLSHLNAQSTHPEVEFCTYNLDLLYGQTINIRDHLHIKDGSIVDSVDYTEVFFTYTLVGANDPTSPPDWNLTEFNNGTDVTVTAADNDPGDGNHGDGEYRIYVYRNGESGYDDHMTIRVANDKDGVYDATCEGWLVGCMFRDADGDNVYTMGVDEAYSGYQIQIDFFDGSSTTVTTDANGAFEVSGPAGNATLEVLSAPSGVLLKSGYTNPATVDNTPGGVTSQYFVYETAGGSIIDLNLSKIVSTATPAIGETIAFLIDVSNTSSTDATGVEIQDVVPNGYSNIATISNGGTSSGSTVTWSGLTISANSTLSLSFEVDVNASGTYVNTAQVTAANEMDLDSTPNNDDGDQSEDDEDSATITPAIPVIGVAKSAGTPVDNGDGTFDVTYTISMENVSSFTGYDIQLSDDLTTEFGTYENNSANVDAAGEYAVLTAPSIVSTTMGATIATINGSYDGDGNPNIINPASGEIMPAGSRVNLQMTIRFYPAVAKTTYDNQAVVSADSGEDGTADGHSTDQSDDDVALTTDPDGDGNPNEAGENDPTQITITLPTSNPVIGVAKVANIPTDNNDGTFDVAYTILMKNHGNVTLHDIQLTDDLTTEFGTYESMSANVDAAGEYAFVSAPSISATTGGATIATLVGAYDGDGTQTILSPTASENMPVGSTVTITYTLRFYPAAAKTSFSNQATASGDSTENSTPDGDTTDLSDSNGCVDSGGSINNLTPNTDADCDGNPNESGENDPTQFTITPTCPANAGNIGY